MTGAELDTVLTQLVTATAPVFTLPGVAGETAGQLLVMQPSTASPPGPELA
jgi:hypothetical protein